MKIQKIEIKNFKGLQNIVIKDVTNLNAFVGKNNSGKSSILHAIDIACLAQKVGNWSNFQPKLEIKDLINDVGDFEIKLTFDNSETVTINSNNNYGPNITNRQAEGPGSILILPDVGINLMKREHKTPLQVYNELQSKNFTSLNALEILYTIKYYSQRNEKGFTQASYDTIIADISQFFPDIANLNSDRNENDRPVLTYEEYGRKLDILYSGTGLKHFLDILIKITLSGASVVLLDEPELGLHPDLQRQFISYLKNLSLAKNLQIFMATHSQVILNYPDELKFYRVLNSGGTRTTEPVDPQAIHTILSDLGIRPSDIFNQDMCLLVEGASEVIYFEHVVRELYKDEFQKVSVGIIQYGGGSADGIIKGTIDVSNIIPTQKYIYWLRDRDARPVDPPSTSSTQFHAALTGLGFECHIFLNREIEYYYTEAVHVAAQDGIAASIAATQAIYNGDQSQKYRHATAAIPNVNTPQGLQLKSLLKQHLTDRAQLPAEIRQVIEGKLMSWRDEILG